MCQVVVILCTSNNDPTVRAGSASTGKTKKYKHDVLILTNKKMGLYVTDE